MNNGIKNGTEKIKKMSEKQKIEFNERPDKAKGKAASARIECGAHR